MNLSVLIVDDEAAIRTQVTTFLERRGIRADGAESGPQALSLLGSQRFDVALVDFRLPGMDGLALVKELRARSESLVLWMMTAYGTVSAAVEAMRAGVDDYLVKPVEPLALAKKLEGVARRLEAERTAASLRDQLRAQGGLATLVGAGSAMQRVRQLVESAARSDLPVLLVGDTGTGKELAARAIHHESARASGPFVAINCSAIPENLAESELFGHVRGAFTGAAETRAGRIASANRGTLLLDELATAAPPLQARLLRVLEDKELSPVGSDATSPVDVRFIAAMNEPPEREIDRGRLRRDLFYRLNVIRIDLPPLRERREDIPALVRVMLARRGEHGREVSQGFLSWLGERDLPGNLRELRNLVDVAAVCSDGPLTVDALPDALRGGATRPPEEPAQPMTLAAAVLACERRQIELALRSTDNHMGKAARLLGIDERSLRRKLTRHGIDRRTLLSGPGQP